eukprot:4245698-Pyramimonas_sp.AAC.3
MAAQVAQRWGEARTLNSSRPVYTRVLTRRPQSSRIPPTRKGIHGHTLPGVWVDARLGCNHQHPTGSDRWVGSLGSGNIRHARGQRRQTTTCVGATGAKTVQYVYSHADYWDAGSSEVENFASLQRKTQAMVETAMLAAFAGLAYYLGTALRLEVRDLTHSHTRRYDMRRTLNTLNGARN